MIRYLLALCALCSPLYAVDRYVSTAGTDSGSGGIGSPWRTVTYGLQNMNGGDTLYLRTGVYAEAKPSDDIIKSGTPSLPTKITSYPGETAIIRPPSTSGSQWYWSIGTDTIARSNIWFERFTIDCINSGSMPGPMMIRQWHSVTITNMMFINSPVCYGFIVTAGSPDDPGGTNLVIRGNTFSNWAFSAIGAPDGRHATYLKRMQNSIFSNNVLTNGHSNATGAASWGIHVFDSQSGFGLTTMSTNLIVENNLVGCDQGGIVIGQTINGSVRNNVVRVRGGSLPGMVVGYGSSGVGTKNTTVDNNTIYGGSSSVTLNFRLQSGVVFRNNILWASSGVSVQNGTTATVSSGWTNNILQSGFQAEVVRTESGNLIGTGFNPAFVNAPSNLMITSGGSARESGLALAGIVTHDILGTVRPQISNWDIGAYEIPQSASATYYVRPGGNDSNPGTADIDGGAWKTITKAASVVNPGDTVYVRAGTYAAFVTLTRAGTLASPITWNFQRDASGNHLAIIDPSTAVSASWVKAPEKDPNDNGVYKHTSLPFEPGVLVANGYMIPRMETDDNFRWDVNHPSFISPTGSTWINAPANQVRKPEYTTSNGSQGPYWDSIEALYAYTNGVGYIRFRNGDNPNSKAIRIASNNGVLSDTWLAKTALRISASYNVVNGAYVRNARAGVAVSATGSQIVTGSVVISNRIENCTLPLGIYGGGDTGKANDANCYSNALVFNNVSHNFIGLQNGESGAWRDKSSVSQDWKAFHAYSFYKSEVSRSNANRPSIALHYCGSSNLVSGNILGDTANPIRMYFDSPQAVRTIISSNTFTDCSSAAILVGDGNGTDLTYIHDNTMEDVQLPLRWHRANKSYSAAANSRTYMFRNRGWNPPAGSLGRGSVIYLHCEGTADTFQSELWFYHNSFEAFEFGFDGVVAISTNQTFLADNNILSKARVLNNIIHAGNTMRHESFIPATDDFGRLDYNRIREMATTAGWFGSRNITSTASVWGSGTTPPASMPDFTLQASSSSVSAGTNLAGLSLPDSRAADSTPDLGAIPYGPTIVLPQVFLTASDPQLFEGGAAVSVRVTRNGSTAGSLAGTVALSGTAEVGAQYTASTSWTIANGDSFVDIPVTPIVDGLLTGDLTIVFTLGASASYTSAGTPANIVYRDATQDLTIHRNPPLPGSFHRFRL